MSQTIHKNVLARLLFTFIISLVVVHVAHADGTPTVTSFTANPTSINNNYTAVLSWNTQNATGYDLYFTCPVGVIVKVNGGGAFPCNTAQSISSNQSDSSPFTFTNVSGTTKNVTVDVYPKDLNGVDYPAGGMSLVISVGTSYQPITSFSLSTTSVVSGTPITLSWTGVDIGGANVQFDCTPGITMYASDPSASSGVQALPCGSTASTSDLPQSGSYTAYPIVTNSSGGTVTAHVLPAITTGLYDATHSLSATFTVTPKPATPNPSVSNFTTPANTVTASSTVNFSWNTQNAAGANIQFSCASGVTISTLVGTTTTSIPCNTPGFNPSLSTNGTTTVLITNTSFTAQSLHVILMPQDTAGTYWGTVAKTLDLLVLAPGATPTVAVPTTNTAVIGATASTTLSTSPTQGTQLFVFTTLLVRGSKGVQVSNLQTLLARNSSIYPEGTVSGYFGPATGAAVARFQIKYGIAKKGDSGYGIVGPKTRAKLNTIATP